MWFQLAPLMKPYHKVGQKQKQKLQQKNSEKFMNWMVIYSELVWSIVIEIMSKTIL